MRDVEELHAELALLAARFVLPDLDPDVDRPMLEAMRLVLPDLSSDVDRAIKLPCDLLVCGRDGLDEVSLSAPTQVREVTGHTVSAWEWTPADFGLEPCTLEDLRVSGPEESAARVREVLAGRPGPAARVVLANAAAALLAAERVGTLAEGVARAAEALDTGAALGVLERLAACSRRPVPA